MTFMMQFMKSSIIIIITLSGCNIYYIFYNVPIVHSMLFLTFIYQKMEKNVKFCVSLDLNKKNCIKLNTFSKIICVLSYKNHTMNDTGEEFFS